MNLSISEIRIATRESKLALWQAEHVATCLREYRSPTGTKNFFTHSLKLNLISLP